MLDLTLAKAQELVGGIVAKQADKVYEKHEGSCLYVHTTRRYDDEKGRHAVVKEEPGCLVGQALIAGGLTMDDLTPHNSIGVTSALYHLQGEDKLTYTRDAEQYLEILQMNQDRGHAWGVAHAKALEGKVWEIIDSYDDVNAGHWVDYDVYQGH
jgi:hypothetical protein